MFDRIFNLFYFSSRYWVVKSGGKYFIRFSTWPHGIKQTVTDDAGVFMAFDSHDAAVKYMLEEID
ncbi:MAG: hypothetical protein ACRC62_32265 [Microcoleus sp.]